MALLAIRISHHSPKAEPSASEAVVDLTHYPKKKCML